MEQQIGSAIRRLRQRKGMTLETLATRTGVSKSYISKIERGLQSPPISTLSNIARALGTEITEFFRTEEQRPRLSLVRATERTRISGPDATFGYHYDAIADRFPDKSVEVFHITLTPNPERHTLFAHDGEEMIFVLQGRMLFLFGDERYVCEEGDCLYFDSSVEHRGECLGDEEARALVVIIPPRR